MYLNLNINKYFLSVMSELDLNKPFHKLTSEEVAKALRTDVKRYKKYFILLIEVYPFKSTKAVCRSMVLMNSKKRNKSQFGRRLRSNSRII